MKKAIDTKCDQWGQPSLRCVERCMNLGTEALCQYFEGKYKCFCVGLEDP